VVPLAAAIVGAVIATVVFIVMYAFADPVNWVQNPGYAVGGAIAQFVIGFLVAFVGGLMGHIFVNDGNLDVPTWDFTDYELIICKRDNWREVFGVFFDRPENVRESFQRLYPIRLDTMHARPITHDDQLLLYVETRRLLKVIRIRSA
jgi:hypothetical protein